MTFRYRVYSSIVLGIAIFGAVCAGCQESATTNEEVVAVERPDPEESFAEIVQFVRSQLETGVGGMPSGFVTQTEGGRRSQFVVRNDVTSDLIKPTKDNPNYRGTITVTTKSTYSYRRPEEDGRSGDSDGKSDENGKRRGLLDETESGGIDVMDSNLVSSPSGDNKKDNSKDSDGESTEVVTRQPFEDARTFDFEYENDRWVLKTEPNPKTEQAIQNAFERALETQP